jgi:hypothetical protein
VVLTPTGFEPTAPVRVFLIAVHGGAAAALAFAISDASRGLVEGWTFLLGLCLAVLTLAFVVAATVNGVLERPGHGRRLPLHARWHRAGRYVSCGTCGRPMVDHDGIWVCARCDDAPSSHG